MEVVSTPSQELALTNCAFVSAADIRRFPNYIALVGDALVLTLRYPHSVFYLVHLPLLWLVRASLAFIYLFSFFSDKYNLPDDEFVWCCDVIDCCCSRKKCATSD